MKPAPFTYHRPGTVGEVVALTGELGGDARILAGGQSLVPLLNLRLARPAHLVDLAALRNELGGVSQPSMGGVTIGALTRHNELLMSPLLGAMAPLVVEAAGHIGHHAIRNRGTAGGSLAHADPAAELPAVALALGSEVEIAGPAGTRRVPAEAFFTGHYATVVADDELLTAWHIPRPVASEGWGFAELARRQGDFALALAAASLAVDGEGTVRSARLVVGGVADRPLLVAAGAEALVGSRGEPAAIDAAVAAVVAAARPRDDVHASANYRRTMVGRMARRAIEQALSRAAAQGRSAAGVDHIGREGTEAHTGRLVGPAARRDQDRPHVVALSVNDNPAAVVVPPRRTLADTLRDELALTGTHLGCEHGVCGACTVLVDGEVVRSCLLFAVQLDGAAVTTIEGVADLAADHRQRDELRPSAPAALHPIQEAFRAHHGLQCGFCTPGMVLAGLDLLRRRPDPDEAQVREALSGNLCRCTGYVKIVEAILAAAQAGAPDG